MKSKSAFSHRFLDRDYQPLAGELGEDKLFAVNHICLHEDCLVFDDLVLPFGSKILEEKSGEVIDEILKELTHLIQSKDRVNRSIIICGKDPARRMLGRKLEDKLKRAVLYE